MACSSSSACCSSSSRREANEVAVAAPAEGEGAAAAPVEDQVAAAALAEGEVVAAAPAEGEGAAAAPAESEGAAAAPAEGEGAPPPICSCGTSREHIGAPVCDLLGPFGVAREMYASGQWQVRDSASDPLGAALITNESFSPNNDYEWASAGLACIRDHFVLIVRRHAHRFHFPPYPPMYVYEYLGGRHFPTPRFHFEHFDLVRRRFRSGPDLRDWNDIGIYQPLTLIPDRDPDRHSLAPHVDLYLARRLLVIQVAADPLPPAPAIPPWLVWHQHFTPDTSVTSTESEPLSTEVPSSTDVTSTSTPLPAQMEATALHVQLSDGEDDAGEDDTVAEGEGTHGRLTGTLTGIPWAQLLRDNPDAVEL